MSLNAIPVRILYTHKNHKHTHREDGSVAVNAKDMNWIHENVQTEKQDIFRKEKLTDFIGIIGK